MGTSLSARVDAFTATKGDESVAVGDMAAVLWSKMQKRIDHVEGQKTAVKSKSLAGSLFTKHEFGGEAEDSAMKEESKDFQLRGSKRKLEDGEGEEPKMKKAKVESEDDEDESEDVDLEEEKARKKAEKKKRKKEKKEKKKKKKAKEDEE